MNCENTKIELSAYLDGELTADQADEVRAHLAACPACAEEFRLLAATWQALLADEAIEAPPDFPRRFWLKAQAQEQGAGRPAGSVFYRLLKWSPAMAAGFLVAFLAGWLSAGGGKPDDAAAAPAEVAFLRDYEVIQQMELLEDLPMLQIADLNNDEGGEQ